MCLTLSSTFKEIGLEWVVNVGMADFGFEVQMLSLK